MSSSKPVKSGSTKSMVDLLVDPLMHMVRNAIDHGIEPAAQRQTSGQARTSETRDCRVRAWKPCRYRHRR